jgi:uncharacterized protein (TIRG00374 family)
VKQPLMDRRIEAPGTRPARRGGWIRNSGFWILNSFLGLAAIVCLFWLFGFDPVRQRLALLRPGLLVAYLALALVALAGYCARWKLVAGALGRRLPWWRLLEARLAGDAIGMLVPSAKLAGEPVRVGLVMREGVPAPEASAGVAIDRLMELIGNIVSLLAYVSVFSLARAGGSTALVATAGVLVGLASLAAPVLMLRSGRRPLSALYGDRARRMLPRLARWMDGLRATEDHLARFFADHPAAFVRGVLLSLLVEMVIVAEYHFLLRAFTVEIEFPVLLMVLLGSGLARVLPSPAALGTLEASQIAVLALAQGMPAAGFVVGVVLRMHETLWILVGLAALAWSGLARGLLTRPVEVDEVAA